MASKEENLAASTPTVHRPVSISLTNDYEESPEKPENVLSPMSPSSHFTRSIIANTRDCIFPYVTLCHWDNIMGPRVRHLWLTRTSSRQLTKDVLQAVSSHTLNSEICRDPTEPHIDLRLNVAPERNLAFYSALFGAMGIHESCVHSLCFVMSHKNLRHFLPMMDTCRLWLLRMVSRLRILLQKTDFDEATATFSRSLSNFIQMIESLRENALPKTIKLVDSAFHPQHKFDPAFLKKAISAHLSSLGRTVVIGHSAGKVNLLISALAMFLSNDEQRCCRYVSEDKALTYHQDLCVQGILQRKDHEFPSQMAELVFCQYPTTVIDLNNSRIVQSSFFPEHYIKRQEALKHEATCIVKEEDHTVPAPKYKVWDLLHQVDDASCASIVNQFMDEFLFLPNDSGKKEGLILLLRNQLYKKALALICYVEDLVKAGKVPLSSHLKRTRQDLDLQGESDFRIVVGVAEKLSPGFSQSLL